MRLTEEHMQALKPLAIEWLLLYGTAGVNYMRGRADELSDAMLKVFNNDASNTVSEAHKCMFVGINPNNMPSLNPEFLKQLGLHEEKTS